MSIFNGLVQNAIIGLIVLIVAVGLAFAVKFISSHNEKNSNTTSTKITVSSTKAIVTTTGRNTLTSDETKSNKIKSDKVEDLKVVSKNSNSVTLNWSRVKGASEYRVMEYSNGKYHTLKTIKGTKTTVKLLANTVPVHVLVVQAKNSKENTWGERSDPVYVKVNFLDECEEYIKDYKDDCCDDYDYDLVDDYVYDYDDECVG